MSCNLFFSRTTHTYANVYVTKAKQVGGTRFRFSSSLSVY
jgi:hypothetical protein